MKNDIIQLLLLSLLLFLLLLNGHNKRESKKKWVLSVKQNLNHEKRRSYIFKSLELSCDSRFQHAFTACSCVFKEITLVWANQRNFFKNAVNECVKRSSQRSLNYVDEITWLL